MPTTARNNAQLFTAAAERVTRLFKSPDRNHFCLAANAVTALYREQEAEVTRAQHRGYVARSEVPFPQVVTRVACVCVPPCCLENDFPLRQGDANWRPACLGEVQGADGVSFFCRARESLRQCLQWVTEQGPYVDAGQLGQLLKQQIDVHSAGASERGETVINEEASGRLSSEDDSLAALLSPDRGTERAASAGNAMEETPDMGSRKRKGDDIFLEDERLLQALPAAWPRKTSRRICRL